jgi:hypothetical protein
MWWKGLGLVACVGFVECVGLDVGFQETNYLAEFIEELRIRHPQGVHH